MEYYDFGASLIRMDDGLRKDSKPMTFETIYSAEESETIEYGFVNATVGIIKFDIWYSGGEIDEDREILVENQINNAYNILFKESDMLFKSLEYVNNVEFIGNYMIVIADTPLKAHLNGIFEAMGKENSMFKALSSKIGLLYENIELRISESMFYGKIRMDRMYRPNGESYFTFSGNGIQKAINNLKYAGNGDLIISPRIALNLNENNLKLTDEVKETGTEGLRKCRIINIAMDEYYKR